MYTSLKSAIVLMSTEFKIFFVFNIYEQYYTIILDE